MPLLPPPRPSFSAALRDLGSRDERLRLTAVDALGNAESVDERRRATAALIPVLRDPHPDVRAAAALSLGDLDCPEAVSPLVAALDDGSSAVRQAAAIALGRLGDPAAFAPLQEKLRHGPPDVRFQAASSLVEVDAGRAYTPLVQALGDEDAEVIGAAALGLGAIGDRRAAGHLSRFLDHPRDETRFDAAYGLARLSDARAVAPLASFLEHPQHAWDAIEGLEMTGSPAAAAALAPLLERRFVARRLRLRAAGALLALDADHRLAGRARQLIVTGLGAWRLEHRALAVVLAGQVGQTWALAPLRALRQSRRGRFLREEIDEALAQLTALCQATSA